MAHGTQASDLIDEFRKRIGDSSRSVPTSYIISYINTALRRLARTDGLGKLFRRRETFELGTVNADGTRAAAWDLGRMGRIIDIEHMVLYKTGGDGIQKIFPRFLEYEDFMVKCTIPELQEPGDPWFYTIEQFGGSNRLLFDRPPKALVAIDLLLQAFHERITTENDYIYVDWAFLDAVQEMVIILNKLETADNSTARALYEDLDLVVTEIKELLAKRPSALGYRLVKRSF